MYAFTITTKAKCRHCINEFDTELQQFLQSKGVSLAGLYYKLEQSKFTKWHAHGTTDNKWNISKEDKFFCYFKEITDEKNWLSYCNKSLLDVGTPFFIAED